MLIDSDLKQPLRTWARQPVWPVACCCCNCSAVTFSFCCSERLCTNMHLELFTFIAEVDFVIQFRRKADKLLLQDFNFERGYLLQLTEDPSVYKLLLLFRSVSTVEDLVEHVLKSLKQHYVTSNRLSFSSVENIGTCNRLFGSRNPVESLCFLVYFFIKPQCVGKFCRLIAEEVAEIIEKEPDTLTFETWQNKSCATEFVVFEVIKDTEALSFHHQSQHYLKVKKALEDLQERARSHDKGYHVLYFFKKVP